MALFRSGVTIGCSSDSEEEIAGTQPKEQGKKERVNGNGRDGCTLRCVWWRCVVAVCGGAKVASLKPRPRVGQRSSWSSRRRGRRSPWAGAGKRTIKRRSVSVSVLTAAENGKRAGQVGQVRPRSTVHTPHGPFAMLSTALYLYEGQAPSPPLSQKEAQSDGRFAACS